MINIEYTLVKWKDGDYEELEITIQENSVGVFCEMMDWDEEEFANNTVRRPIEVEEELDPENEEYIVTEDPINSRQTIKPIKIDAKKLPKKMHEILAEKDPHKRHRRTKEEMDIARKDEKMLRENKLKKQGGQNKFPPEMESFVEEQMNNNSTAQICALIKIKFGVEVTSSQLSNYMFMRKLKRDNPNKQREERGEGIKKEDEKKKSDKPREYKKKYTDEVIEFLRDNINNFSNRELSGELESQFNLKVSPETLGGVLSQNGIKRDEFLNFSISEEIIDFILKSKHTDHYVLRDDIIEKFEENIPTVKIKQLMAKRIPVGESVHDEVARIKNKRESEEDEMDFLDEE